MLRWIGRLFLRRKPRPQEATPGLREAEAALERAQAAQSVEDERTVEVAAAMHRLRELRERNHFAEMFRAAMGGER
ncbi:DUF7620 family protein [Streptantibioticus silvisoli]|uniref:DUF7620 family protein n=1 Tax=Streptantibioticus silvisoli TaxID=2705255 RepID=UPI003FD7910D